MKKLTIILILAFIVFVSCKQSKQEKQQVTPEKFEFTELIKEDYELYKPTKEIKAVLILFGGATQKLLKTLKESLKFLILLEKIILRLYFLILIRNYGLKKTNNNNLPKVYKL
ncbi:hypothetical protein [Tenacibaculum sp.]|uniref:hypothetical protein n=1 Tax=Tenacibaculum sp. TaxID=1906242 RepID=UPI003AA957A8